ncbi:hypothetical protein Tco_0201537 [Tanacetum coccineum]
MLPGVLPSASLYDFAWDYVMNSFIIAYLNVNTPYCLGEQILCLDCRIQYIVLGRRFDMSNPTGGYGILGEAESFDPYYGDYIELNDLDMPLEPRMNRDNEFEPTINECIIVNEPTKQILLQNDEDDHGGNELAETLIDMPIFVGNFSIISGFTIIDDMDRTSGVVLGMPLCKKFVSCQKTIEKFARRDECQRLKDE